MKINNAPDSGKQSQFISVQCSAFSGERQDEEKEFEKTKPIKLAACNNLDDSGDTCRAVLVCGLCFLYCSRTNFVFRYLCYWVKCVNCKHIGGAFAEMERHEQPADSNIIRNLCQGCDLTTSGNNFDAISIGNIEFFGVAGMYLHIAGW